MLFEKVGQGAFLETLCCYRFTALITFNNWKTGTGKTVT